MLWQSYVWLTHVCCRHTDPTSACNVGHGYIMGSACAVAGHAPLSYTSTHLLQITTILLTQLQVSIYAVYVDNSDDNNKHCRESANNLP